jgi:hypothetical protein
MSLKTETRLETHRNELIRSKGLGPLIKIDDLTPEELELVNSDFLESCHGNAEDVNQIYSLYVEALHRWGIMCPHPQIHKRYDGYIKNDTPLDFEESKWFECKLCCTYVINR